MKRLLRVLWIAGALAFIALFVFTWRGQIDPVAHDHYAHDIREVETLDARLSGEIMQSRQSLVTHYDDIVGTLASLERLHRRLREVPRFLPPGERSEIATLVDASADALQVKEGAIETFKSENAILRNSVHFFPVGALELRDRLQAREDVPELAAAVNELLCNVLRFNTQPGDTLRERATKDLDVLEQQTVPKEVEDDVASVVTHAKVVLARRDGVDQLTNAILNQPTRARIDAVDVLYARAFQSALRASEQRRIGLFVLALFVVALVSADIIRELRRVAKGEREASEKLAAANAALLREKQREKELNELKSRFVSMTSHEFRTPLSVILSSAELVEAYGDRWSASKKSDHFSRIKGAVRTMADLLDGVLVVGKADMGKLSSSPALLDIARYCRELVDTTLPTLSPAHSFEHHIQADFGQAWVDEKLLSHILTNLLSNAVKYSPDGGAVRFDARREGDEARFEIADHGIGILEVDKARLYESFHRGGNVGHIPGTGLGLAVVKRSVDAHGGTLEVTSKEGEGTSVVVRLPIGSKESVALPGTHTNGGVAGAEAEAP